MNWEDFKILVELQVIVVFLIDLSGAVDSLKDGLGRWLRVKVGRLKPFDCSLCMYHWTALLVMLCLGRLTLETYLVICLLAFATTLTAAVLETILRVLIWIVSLLKV